MIAKPSTRAIDVDESGRFPLRPSSLLDVLAGLAGLLSRGRSIDLGSTLRLIGEAVGVDRMYLFENDVEPETGRTRCTQRFEWAHTSVSPEIDNPTLVQLAYADASDVLEDVLRRGEAFAGVTRELEPKLRAVLEPQGILSVCLVPVMIDEQLWGFVGFDDCHCEREWTAEEVTFLQLIAAIVGGSVAREQIRSALRETEAQYRYLVDNVHEVIFETDRERRITFLNRSWERQLGYRIDESLGAPLVEFIEPDRRAIVLREVDETIGGGSNTYRHAAPFIAKSGEQRWMQILCRFKRDEHGAVTGVLGTMTDVTERRWAEEAMRRQQLDESLSTLAGGIAHDFNNVLHGMLAAVQILALDHAEDPRSAELLDAIRTSGERMADMTSQLLAYSRGGSHEAAPLDPQTLVEDALKIARLPPNVRVVLAPPPAPFACVEGDRGQLFQVVLNLVVNAVEAMERGGELRIDVRALELDAADALVRDRTLKAGSYVRLSFADGGRGIDPAARSRIFDPFFSTKARGRGLGLAAARGIAAKHGGTITVESELGRGSTFHVVLPRHEGALPAGTESTLKPVHGGLVLLVDDEEHILHVTAAGLEQAGHRVLRARNGREALELFDAHAGEIDAALVDYVMPELDGGELVRALLARDPELRVILCTGYHQRDESLGGVPRLEKPFPIATLLAMLER